jgi:tyrosinase
LKSGYAVNREADLQAIVGSMVPMTSPNDPVFFLHHCYVDKIWADWQALQKQYNPDFAPHYAPEKAGPPGHNLDDVMSPWNRRRVRDLLDISELGYTYEEAATDREILSIAEKIAPISPFDVQRSPFWAD